MSKESYPDDGWKPVPGFEGRYEVHRQGAVRSVEHVVMRSNGIPQRIRGRLLKPSLKNGYHAVGLGTKPAYVHELVLKAFVGPRPAGYQCCHGDGDRLNNDVSNLRWDTRSANAQDMLMHGTHKPSSKVRCDAGHPFDEENTYMRPGRKGRDCRECTRERGRKYRRRLSAGRSMLGAAS